MKKKAVFITASDILNPYGNGGVKASREHLQLVKEVLYIHLLPHLTI